MFYTIYKTINTITMQEYIGQHITNNLADNYLGSGIRITSSIRKYGKENFSKEILFVFDNKEEMNQKEKELVNSTYIRKSNTLNVIEGGGFNTTGTVVVLNKETNKWIRIPIETFNKEDDITPTKGTLAVADLQNKNNLFRISSEEYRENKDKYITPSSGRITVYDRVSNKNLSIKQEDFDNSIHKCVAGGIVSEIDGIRKYVTREEFKNLGLSGVHKGKITALDKETGKRRHVTKEEYYCNRSRYQFNTEGFVTGTNKLTGEKVRIHKDEVKNNKGDINFTTHGNKTVFCLKQNVFKNILTTDYNKDLYKFAQDKMFICYSPDGTEKFRFWGSKKDFFLNYGGTETLWKTVLDQGTVSKNTKEKTSSYRGCKFKLIKWKEIPSISEVWETLKI